MGGDPTGERSHPGRMILVCIQRHRENKVSIDKGTIACWPLTPCGTDGPVMWVMKLESFIELGVEGHHVYVNNGWVTLATESSPGVLEPLSTPLRAALVKLGDRLTS